MYTDQARVEAYLKRELTEDEQNILDDVISYVSSDIENYTNRTWYSVDTSDDDIDAEAAEERLFDGNGRRELFVDDFSILSKIEFLDDFGSVNLTYQASTDWLLYPLNTTPKNSIRLTGDVFPHGAGNIAITAIWGAGVVPAGVIMACTALVAKYMQKAGSNAGMFKSESIEGYSYQLLSGAEIDSDTNRIMDTLDKWKKVIL